MKQSTPHPRALLASLLALAMIVMAPAANALWFNPGAGNVFGTPGTPFPLDDDDSFGPIPLGFTFPFFGVDQTAVYFNSNGSLTFGGGRNSWDNYPLPRSGPDQYGDTILPTIAPLFDDHDNRFGGVLSFIDLLPGIFVASWDGVPLYLDGDPGGAENAFQAVLLGPGHPFDPAVFPVGTIVFNYGDLNGTGGTCDNDCDGDGWEDSVGTATIGLNLGDGIGFATLFPLGIGDPGGLVTPADFAALENPALDPFLFIPDGQGGYTVQAIPFSALPGIAGFTTNVPEPGTLALLLLGLGIAAGARRRTVPRSSPG